MAKIKPTTNLTVSRTLLITELMDTQIKTLAAKQQTKTKHKVSEAEIVREAIRAYIAQQDDLYMTRASGNKNLRERLETLEQAQKEREAEMEGRLMARLSEGFKVLHRAIKDLQLPDEQAR